MSHNIYIYILVMAGVSYLIRMLPLTLIRKEIKNKTIRSFLYYVPYVTLAVMTFPAILSATGSVWSAWAALIVATALAWFGKSLRDDRVSSVDAGSVCLLRNAGYISRSRRCYPENRKTFSRGIDTVYGKSICREKK